MTAALPKFNPAHDFTPVRGPLTVNGTTVLPGDTVPRGNLTDRRMRQLYESRLVAVAAVNRAERAMGMAPGGDPTDIATLRDQYKALTGKPAPTQWNSKTLASRIRRVLA